MATTPLQQRSHGRQDKSEEKSEEESGQDKMEEELEEESRQDKSEEELEDESEEESGKDAKAIGKTEKKPEKTTGGDTPVYFLKDLDAKISRGDTIEDQLVRNFDQNQYRPLYLATIRGDWQSASSFLNEHPEAVTSNKISMFKRTALHVAAIESQTEFVRKLLEIMPEETTALRDTGGSTALHYAAVDGNLASVKALVRKNPDLPQIVNNSGDTPLFCAVFLSSGEKEMSTPKALEYKEVIWFLTLVTRDEQPNDPFTGSKGANLIVILTYAGHYDISLYIVKRYPNLITARYKESTILMALAAKPSAFLRGSKFGFWKRYIYPFIPVEPKHAPPLSLTSDIENLPESSIYPEHMPTLIRSKTYITQVLYWLTTMLWKAMEYLVPGMKNFRDDRLRHQQANELLNYIVAQLLQNNSHEQQLYDLIAAISVAVKFGTVEIVKACLQNFPDLIWIAGKQVLEISIKQRQENIFNLVSKINVRNKLFAWAVAETDKSHILHITATLAPSAKLTSISGSVFQLQRELQWYKEVEKLIPPYYRISENEEGKTPWVRFVEEHKELTEKGEKWMKDTSNSCMVVSTLIATVVFAAAFTVPGGNDNNNGIPLFLRKNSFSVFAICDALALFSSITSLLMFLSILTARYAVEDFLTSLPKRLIIGLASLFFALATMMIAFGAALSIVLDQRWKWITMPITLLASFPLIMFLMLQLPLLIQMTQSTYGSGIFRPQRIW